MANASTIMTGLSDGVVRAERSANGAWRITKTLQGKDVRCLAQDPSHPSTAYAGTRQDGVWRTEDRGQTWKQRGMEGQIVTSLAVSPHDPGVIYAGSKPALLFQTKDGGGSWEELTGFRRIPNRWWWFSPADPPDMRPYIISAAVSPSDPKILLAGVEFGGVFRSTDGGRTWSRHIRRSLRDCHALMFHATDPRYVYEAGGTGGGAAMSTDGGVTWAKHKDGLDQNYGVVCAADAIDPTTWYVCVGQSPGKVYGRPAEALLYRSSKSTDWEPIGWQPHPLTETPTALTTPTGRSGEIYAGVSTGDVWHSSDYGDTWEKMPFNLSGMGHSLLYFDA